MSFRTAYSDLKSGRRARGPQGLISDPTPEEWKKTMDEYYKKQQANKYSGTRGRR
jgi:hypothetical protein